MSSALLALAACADEPTETEDGDQETVVENPEEIDDNGSETSEDTPTDGEDLGPDEEVASYTLNMYDSENTEIGTATFDETEDELSLTVILEGVPAGEYDMNIHQNGQATPPLFEDAGDYFNPTDASEDSEEENHLGDLPVLEVPENGSINETITIPELSILPDAEYTLATEEGTSLIIQTVQGDFEDNPEPIERIAGGVIFAPEN